MSRLEVAVVGAGIVGLAHAWSAAKRGHAVRVFERTPTGRGASIRNFGMVWPIGQPAGECHQVALESRRLWLELGRDADIWVNPCGSVHLAHREDEWEVLREFARLGPESGYECSLLDRAAVLDVSPGANPHGLLGGLHSPAELCVNPRAAIRRMPSWLHAAYGVEFDFNTAVVSVGAGDVRAADGRTWRCDRAVVCGGADFETLFPDVFARSGLRRCKLQMMKTAAQRPGWRLGPHLASGLTLRHYSNFALCPGIDAVRRRIAAESPELDRYGIHVMASQNNEGEVVLGDSHEYDERIEPFDKAEIDELMLRELRKVLHLPDWTLSERWHGVYAKNPSGPVFAAEPVEGVSVRSGTGGAGMTMSFGLAEQDWETWR
ncbi:MAG TPA: TIGR03364 family FAD-dependent oxidoreductase [Pirellulaceae bacterium]|nr:TIGR03364 family FAD-dependent oxidoreductase [Pirellulaceae bacterium]